MVATVFRTIFAERGAIEVFFDARADFANPMGNVQGGFLAAMLDDTLGPALAATLGDGEFAPPWSCRSAFYAPPLPAGSPA
jgi:acyl-coenzyme A thioesterase PaaI-like protein